MKIPKTGGGELVLDTEAGSSVLIIGANGSGKTRLGVYFDQSQAVHRISAHKSLALNDDIVLVSLDRAEKALLYGHEQGQSAHKLGNRWANKPAVHLLNDFNALLQSLFAENNRIAIKHMAEHRKNPKVTVPRTRIERLKEIWDSLLPHRQLEILDASVRVQLATSPLVGSYSASEMSDGERAIFYFLGHCLMAPNGSTVVVDEPEGHVHKAILGPLWDAIEKARPDCAFVYITHDLDFAVTRPAGAKYYIRSYTHEPQSWDIAELPKGTGLPDDVVAEIVGSRRPILFVEGERGSLDVTFYRHHYDGFTVVPIGSCDAVIHSVSTYKNSGALHWLDAKGLVDADHRSAESLAALLAKHVYVLPVAEVENLLLLPDMFSALAEAMALVPAECLTKLKDKVMKAATEQTEGVSLRYTSRRLDERLKRVAHAAGDLPSLEASYQKELAGIDPAAIYKEFRQMFEKAIADGDLELVLKLFDNKGLPSTAAGVLNLKDNSQKLMERIERLLGDENKGAKLRAALTKYLPDIPGGAKITASKSDGVPHDGAATPVQAASA